MKIAHILFNPKRVRWAGMTMLACLLAGVAGADTVLTSGRLGEVEYRAMLAQALIQKVEEMEAEAATLRQQLADKDAQLAEKEAKVKEVHDSLAQTRKEMDALRKASEVSKDQIAQLGQLLAMFRRGSYEYYEVREGDTLESIAANPMVYGDAGRVAWLKQANTLPETGVLVPGMVLIIPRFPEGMSYDL